MNVYAPLCAVRMYHVSIRTRNVHKCTSGTSVSYEHSSYEGTWTFSVSWKTLLKKHMQLLDTEHGEVVETMELCSLFWTRKVRDQLFCSETLTSPPLPLPHTHSHFLHQCCSLRSLNELQGIVWCGQKVLHVDKKRGSALFWWTHCKIQSHVEKTPFARWLYDKARLASKKKRNLLPTSYLCVKPKYFEVEIAFLTDFPETYISHIPMQHTGNVQLCQIEWQDHGLDEKWVFQRVCKKWTEVY